MRGERGRESCTLQQVLLSDLKSSGEASCRPFSAGLPGQESLFIRRPVSVFRLPVIPNLDPPHHPQAGFLRFGGRLFCFEAPPIARLGLLLSKEWQFTPEEHRELLWPLSFRLPSSSFPGYSWHYIIVICPSLIVLCFNLIMGISKSAEKYSNNKPCLTIISGRQSCSGSMCLVNCYTANLGFLFSYVNGVYL